MANIKNIGNKAVKPIDNYLKFVQQSFNTGDISFVGILKQLRDIIKLGQRKDSVSRPSQTTVAQATQLANQLNNITILREPSKYRKFDKLGNFGLGDNGLKEAYKASEEIIKDINVARKWIDSYKKFQVESSNSNVGDLHQELLVLGKSILGRAIELCPKDTGYLRSTGVLFDFGTYIVIAFLAPYATYVHENMDIVHPVHPHNTDCGGTSKFLEKAVQEFFPDRSVWTEILGKGEVAVKIAINPVLVEYTHYS
jgi:hypothetical protein